jgi:hypothetical protein
MSQIIESLHFRDHRWRSGKELPFGRIVTRKISEAASFSAQSIRGIKLEKYLGGIEFPLHD